MFRQNLDTNYGFLIIKYHVLKAQGGPKTSLFINFFQTCSHLWFLGKLTALYLTTTTTSAVMIAAPTAAEATQQGTSCWSVFLIF